ncbi:MAG: ATP-grasp domain-containing protein, partial [Hyphomonadaceae bacterium]
MNALAPGAAIGILGGGQLGRMLALAGAELGFDIVIYTPEPDSPAGRVAARTIVAGYDDAEALAAFAQETAAITYEFENVPAATAAALIELGALVRPGAASLDAAQDRIAEKRFFAQHAVQTAPYCAIDTEADLEAALSRTGLPAILKTRRLGYDGIGQARVASLEEAKRAFRETLHGAPAIAEGVVAVEREISIIAARGADGMIAFYDL